MRTYSVLAATVAIAPLMAATPALAQSKAFNLPAQPAVTGIPELARQADVQMLVSEAVTRGKTISAVRGTMSIEEALRLAFAGTGLHASTLDGRTFIVSATDTHSNARAVAASASSGEADAGSAPAENPGADIIVTGTQIHGEAPIGAHLTVLDRKAIKNSGHATVAEYIQTLPQNYSGGSNEENYLSNPHADDNRAFGSSINLRGLGTESTLVLFDGIRPAMGGALGAFTDTSIIPSSAIDRIEILADGASAIYGTDAVAGVVNIRFRDHFDGFETHVYSGVIGGDSHQEQFSQAFGKRWGSGGLFVAYQYDHRSRLSGDSRSYWTEDLRPWGGPDLREPGSLPGTIIAADGETFAIPAGQDGRNLTAADLIAGTQNLSDQRKTIDILPERTTHSIYGAIDQKVTSGISAYVRALFTYRTYTSNIQSFVNPYTVPTNNPFYVDPIGTGQPVSVEYDFAPELGHYQIGGNLKALTTSAGLKGSLAGWSLDVNGTYGNQQERETESNGVSSTRVAIALADTNPATSLNLFGSGSSNNPATLAYIRSTYRDFSNSRAWSATFRGDGPLFDVPAGTVKLAVGAEHRHDSFSAGYYTNSVETSPDAYDLFQQPGTPGSRNVDAVFGELSIPILNAPDGKFPGKLDLSLAGRTDWYSDVGRTSNPKIGLGWTVVPGLKFRGSWGTSFRAPSFAEKGSPENNAYYAILNPDMHSPTGYTPVILLWGYSPNMRPEKAVSWTAGFDAQLHAIPGITISATYFSIAYRDRIESLAEDYGQILNHPEVYGSLIETPTPAEVAAIYADPRFSDLSGGSPASDIQYILNVQTQNVARQNIRGVDFNVTYVHDLMGGSLATDIAGTRLIAMSQRISGSGTASNILGTIYNPADLRFRGHLGWSKAGFSLDGFANYTGSYTNTLATPVQRVSSWTTFDAQIGYRFSDASPLKGARIALSATNLANRKPPYVEYIEPGITLGYDPNQASAIGREMSVDLTFQW